MRYNSTRNHQLTATPAEAVLHGIAPDGGLYLCDPAALALDPAKMLQKDFSGMAEAVLGVLSLLGRADIKVVTQGVSREVIDQLDEHSNVIGVVVPNSYEIGRLLAYACAHYFLGVEPAPFVAVDPVAFTPQNLSGAWLSVMKNKLT